MLDRPGLKGIGEISRLSQAVVRALRLELERNHSMPIKGDVTVCDALLTKISSLRSVMSGKSWIVFLINMFQGDKYVTYGCFRETEKICTTSRVSSATQGIV